MSPRWLILGAVLVVAVASLAVITSGGSSGEGSSAPRAAASGEGDGVAATGAREGAGAEARPPRLPAPVRMRSSGGAGGSYEPYEREERDPGWAPEKEALVERRVRSILTDSVEIDDLECRTRRCRLAVRGTDPDAFVAFVDSLQDERGFLGVADRLMLRNLQRGEESSSVEVYLLFQE